MKLLVTLLFLISSLIGQQVVNIGGGCPTYLNIIPFPLVSYYNHPGILKVALREPGDFPESLLMMSFANAPIRMFQPPMSLRAFGLPLGCSLMLEPYYMMPMSFTGAPGDCEILFTLPNLRGMYDVIIQFMVFDSYLPAGFCMSSAVRCLI
jgi:hypothetical protein